jgi:hypothetical protein
VNHSSQTKAPREAAWLTLHFIVDSKVCGLNLGEDNNTHLYIVYSIITLLSIVYYGALVVAWHGNQ